MKRYEKLSDEDVDRLKQEIREILDRMFNHRDFSVLSSKWKMIHNDQVADVIITIIDMEISKYNENA